MPNALAVSTVRIRKRSMMLAARLPMRETTPISTVTEATNRDVNRMKNVASAVLAILPTTTFVFPKERNVANATIPRRLFLLPHLVALTR